jgi:hypothetical protein
MESTVRCPNCRSFLGGTSRERLSVSNRKTIPNTSDKETNPTPAEPSQATVKPSPFGSGNSDDSLPGSPISSKEEFNAEQKLDHDPVDDEDSTVQKPSWIIAGISISAFGIAVCLTSVAGYILNGNAIHNFASLCNGANPFCWYQTTTVTFVADLFLLFMAGGYVLSFGLGFPKRLDYRKITRALKLFGGFLVVSAILQYFWADIILNLLPRLGMINSISHMGYSSAVLFVSGVCLIFAPGLYFKKETSSDWLRSKITGSILALISAACLLGSSFLAPLGSTYLAATGPPASLYPSFPSLSAFHAYMFGELHYLTGYPEKLGELGLTLIATASLFFVSSSRRWNLVATVFALVGLVIVSADLVLGAYDFVTEPIWTLVSAGKAYAIVYVIAALGFAVSGLVSFAAIGLGLPYFANRIRAQPERQEVLIGIRVN